MTHPQTQRCSKPGGHGFQEWRIVHPAERDGRTVIIDDVPAEVCFLCGQTRIAEDTLSQIERILDQTRSGRRIPFVEFE